MKEKHLWLIYACILAFGTAKMSQAWNVEMLESFAIFLGGMASGMAVMQSIVSNKEEDSE